MLPKGSIAHKEKDGFWFISLLIMSVSSGSAEVDPVEMIKNQDCRDFGFNADTWLKNM